MKSIIYILVNNDGAVLTISKDIDKDDQDLHNSILLEKHDPTERIITPLVNLVNKGYSLSNWHIIEKIS